MDDKIMANNGVVPVTRKRHGDRYWQRFNTYAFAASQVTCPVVSPEVLQVAAAFPMLFQSDGERIEPVALFSMTAGLASPFVSDDGKWLACYVPSALRCFPFRAERLGKKQYRLLVDEASGLISSDPEDMPFFTRDGRVTTELQSVLDFFRMREAAVRETYKICKRIQSLGLFSRFGPASGSNSLPELLMVDEDELAEYLGSGSNEPIPVTALRMIHAHQVSLSHCEWLSEAQCQRQKYRPKPSSGLCGFVSALGQDMIRLQHENRVTYAQG